MFAFEAELLLEFVDLAVDGRQGNLHAMLLDQTLVDARCGVPLLAPTIPVFGQPLPE